MAKKKIEKQYRVSWNQRINGVVKNFEFICTKKNNKFYAEGKALILPPATAKVEEL